MTHELFVYGTLREGFPNYRYNHGERIAGTFQTVEPYPLYLHGARFSPCLVNYPGTGFLVRGEVFQVNDAVLTAMDRLERVDSLDGYRRHKIEVTSDESLKPNNREVFVYLMDECLVKDIRSGAHREYTPELAMQYRPREIVKEMDR